MRLIVVVALLAAGCGDLFHKENSDAPQGYTCSPTGGCPPGQQCVPGEHVCRTPCTQTSLTGMGGPTGGGNNGQCNNIYDGSSNFSGWSCDYDHFCRPGCNNGGGGGGSCNSCGNGGSGICDGTVNVCRPACSTGCPSSWGCIDFSNGSNPGPTTGCLACRPLATGGFVPPSFSPIAVTDAGVSGQHTSGVVVGDLGTGHPSVIALDGSASKVYVFGNGGDGVLTAPTAYSLANQPFHAAVADLTHDGKPDLVIASVPKFVVLPGNGDGTFGSAVVGPAFPSTNLVTGDFNGDGKPDAAFCGSGTNQLNIVTGDGAGGFTVLASFASPNNGASFVRIGAADFNNDKKLDLYVDDEHGGLTLVFNGGGATFSLNTSPGPLMTGLRIDDVAFDADGDKLPDVVALQKMMVPAYAILIAHDGVSSGLVMSSQITLPGATALAAGDFDGDGHVDAAVSDQETAGNNGVHLLSGTGKTLAYAAMVKVPSGGPGSIAVGDLNGDGKPDIVVGLGGGGVGVFLNQTIR